MRVNYTLPGFLPAEAAPAETARTGDSPFRARLKFVPAPRWLTGRACCTWKTLRSTQPAIGPPPRASRLRNRGMPLPTGCIWRQMLDRQVANLEEDSQPDAPPGEDAKAIERMLSLLMRFRDVEDEIAARYLAEPEG